MSKCRKQNYFSLFLSQWLKTPETPIPCPASTVLEFAWRRVYLDYIAKRFINLPSLISYLSNSPLYNNVYNNVNKNEYKFAYMCYAS